jgi:hypothetical protein
MRYAALLLLCGIAFGQNLPDAPHKFLDKQNAIVAGSFLAFSAWDAVSTERNATGSPRKYAFNEDNPLVPHTQAGRIAYDAGTVAATLAGAYLFHRTGHHRLERWTLRVALALEVDASTYSWSHYHLPGK